MRREGEKSRHMKSPVESHVLAATALSYLCTSNYYIGRSVTGTSWRKCKVEYVHKGLPYKSFVWQAPDWQNRREFPSFHAVGVVGRST